MHNELYVPMAISPQALRIINNLRFGSTSAGQRHAAVQVVLARAFTYQIVLWNVDIMNSIACMCNRMCTLQFCQPHSGSQRLMDSLDVNARKNG